MQVDFGPDPVKSHEALVNGESGVWGDNKGVKDGPFIDLWKPQAVRLGR